MGWIGRGVQTSENSAKSLLQRATYFISTQMSILSQRPSVLLFSASLRGLCGSVVKIARDTATTGAQRSTELWETN